jgi:hypothetical protein
VKNAPESAENSRIQNPGIALKFARSAPENAKGTLFPSPLVMRIQIYIAISKPGIPVFLYSPIGETPFRRQSGQDDHMKSFIWMDISPVTEKYYP